MLCGIGNSAGYMYNGIKDDFNIDTVILEEKPDPKRIIIRRIKKLGLFKVIDQLFFQFLISKILILTSKKRNNELLKKYNLIKLIPLEKITYVTSVNSEKSLNLIKSIEADIVIVNGTRIISKQILNSTNALFINTHVGITPEYRGVHGGYWALRNKDIENCGVTIHQVDSGIDTGDIIIQDVIKISKHDNFITYPIHQINKAIYMMKEVLISIDNKKIKTYKKENSPSKLWYHPTLTGYLYNRIFKGVR